MKMPMMRDTISSTNTVRDRDMGKGRDRGMVVELDMGMDKRDRDI